MLRDPLIFRSSPVLLSIALSLTACSSGTAGSRPFADPTPTTDPTTDGSSDTGDDGSSSGDVDPGPTSSTTTGSTAKPDTSTTGLADAPARLVWNVDNAAVDYGGVPVDGDTTTLIELENVGDFTATSMATGTIPGDFSFPGGYPGTNGTCTDMLEPGQTCRLDLRFGPVSEGPVESSLVLEYYDGVDLSAPTTTDPLTLLGAGHGESANLLINGDAEAGDTSSWSVPAGLANWQTTGAAFGGSFAFTPTGAIVVTSLDQEVDLSDWQGPTAATGLRYRVRARARSNGSHTYRVYVDFGAGFLPLGEGTQASWTLVEHTDTVPVGSTSATVRIECANNEIGAGPCEVSFDDVTLQMVYP